MLQPKPRDPRKLAGDVEVAELRLDNIHFDDTLPFAVERCFFEPEDGSCCSSQIRP